MPDSTVIVGSRGSKLARRQRQNAVDALSNALPDVRFSEVDVRTAGDIDRSSPVRAIGVSVFVGELQTALLNGEIDIAIHSMKDLPTTSPEGLTVAAVPYREDPRDAVVSRTGAGLDDLPSGGIVATGSPRRTALLHLRRPDLAVHFIRGNVTTRVEKLDAGDLELDALLLAAAGLNRLGMSDRIAQYLSCMKFVSAPAQGALALECRTDDRGILEMCQMIEHAETRTCVDVERDFIRAVGAGCSTPVGAHAKIRDGSITLATFLSNPAASDTMTVRQSVAIGEASGLGASVAREMLGGGAARLIDAE